MTTVYRLYDNAGRLLYVGIADDWWQRLKDHSGRAPWFPQASSLALEHHPDREAARAVEADAIRQEWPLWNRNGSPWSSVAERMQQNAERSRRRLWDESTSRRRRRRKPWPESRGAARDSVLARIAREVDEETARERLLRDTRTEVCARPLAGATVGGEPLDVA